jgi:hypothetical protein
MDKILVIAVYTYVISVLKKVQQIEFFIFEFYISPKMLYISGKRAQFSKNDGVCFISIAQVVMGEIANSRKLVWLTAVHFVFSDCCHIK